MTVVDGTVLRFAVTANVEAFLANIDLDTVEDTDEAENLSDYEALRALPVTDIGRKLPELVNDWNARSLPKRRRCCDAAQPDDVPNERQ